MGMQCGNVYALAGIRLLLFHQNYDGKAVTE